MRPHHGVAQTYPGMPMPPHMARAQAYVGKSVFDRLSELRPDLPRAMPEASEEPSAQDAPGAAPREGFQS